MEYLSLETSFDNRLSDEKLIRILPALSLLAEDVGERILLDSNSLRDILVNVNVDQEEWAFKELGLWRDWLKSSMEG